MAEEIRLFDVHIRGMTPLLMHSGQLADPLNPWVKAIKALPRKKSDDELIEMGRLEFQGSLYWAEKLGPYVPGEMLESVIKEGARKRKKGKSVEASLFAYSEKDPAARFPLIYKGPRERDALWADERFRDRRSAGVQASRVMRTRPRFDDWSLKFSIQLFPSDINPSDVEQAIVAASVFVGMGDYRPKFGRFALLSFSEVVAKAA